MVKTDHLRLFLDLEQGKSDTVVEPLALKVTDSILVMCMKDPVSFNA